MQNGFNRLGFIAIIYEACTCFEKQISDPYGTNMDPHLCLHIHTHRTHKLLAERHWQAVRINKYPPHSKAISLLPAINQVAGR